MKFSEVEADPEGDLENKQDYIRQMFLVMRILQWIYDLCIISLLAATIQLRQIVRFFTINFFTFT